MFHLKLASCMAENSENFCHAVARYINEHLDVSTEYVTGIPWQERERLFDDGDIDILWLCGLPYVQKKADASAKKDIELLVLPIPDGERYLGRPVYFSDVVVRRHSPYQTLLDSPRRRVGVQRASIPFRLQRRARLFVRVGTK